jgi:S-adenosylmethionine-diacylgycerolhomoserine-N-methlytransferase
MNSRAQILQKYYRWHAPIYDVTRRFFLFGRGQIARIWQPPRATASVLEVGTGTGTVLLAFAKRFPKISALGVDLSPTMLAIARRKLHRFFARVRVAQLLVSDLPPHNQFDAAICSYVLSMCSDSHDELLQDICKRLKPGGQLLIVDFHSSRWRWFNRWMAVNHVTMQPDLAEKIRMLGFVTQTTIHSVLGVWRYQRIVAIFGGQHS